MFGHFHRQIERMYRKQTAKEFGSHQELAFIRSDYFRLSSECRAKLKEDMAALDQIMDRLGIMHLGVGKTIQYYLDGEPPFHLELTPKQWLAAMILWDETESD
jgi:hypothetical protein